MLIFLICIALGIAYWYWKKKKDAAGNASYQSGQSTQFQGQQFQGQQFQGQQFQGQQFQGQQSQEQQFQGQQSHKFCYKCGGEIEAEAAYCPFCGAAQNM